jgi:hypothetical protein
MTLIIWRTFLPRSMVDGADALFFSVVEKDSSKPSSFQTKDIRKDLKVLSLLVDAYVGR